MAKLPATSMGPGFHPYLVDQNNYFTVQKDQTAVPAKNFLMQPTMASLNCIYLYKYSFFILPRYTVDLPKILQHNQTASTTKIFRSSSQRARCSKVLLSVTLPLVCKGITITPSSPVTNH